MALNLLTNSLILGNAVSSRWAGAFIFSVSLAQLVVSPWVAAMELAWSGAPNSIADKWAVPPFFKEMSVLVTLSSALCVVGALVSLASTRLFLIVGLPCIAVTAVAMLQNLLVRMKYLETGRFILFVTIGNLVALICKISAAWFGAGQGLILLTLVSDLCIVSAICGFVWMRRTAGQPRTGPPVSKQGVAILVGNGLSIYALLLSARSLLIVMHFVIDEKSYAALGLAFQMVNSVTLFSTAMVGSLRAGMAGQFDHTKPRSTAVRKAIGLTGAMTFAYAVGIWVFAPPALRLLMPVYAEPVAVMLRGLLAYVPAVLLFATAIALAPRSTGLISFGLIIVSAASALFLLMPVDITLESKLHLWSFGMLACAVLLLAIVYIKSDADAPAR